MSIYEYHTRALLPYLLSYDTSDLCEVPVSNPNWELSILTEIFHGFPVSLRHAM